MPSRAASSSTRSTFRGLRGKGCRQLLLGGFQAAARAVAVPRASCARRTPDVVSRPAATSPSRPAWRRQLGVPLVLLNADAAPLLSTRCWRRWRRACCAASTARRREGWRQGRWYRQSGARRDRRVPTAGAALRRPQRPAAAAGRRRQPRRPGAQRNRAAGTGADRRPSAAAVVHQCGAQPSSTQLRASYAAAGVEAEVGRLHRRHGGGATPRPTW